MVQSITLLAMDVGNKRVGLAVASSFARLPRPLPTLVRNDHFWRELKKLTTDEGIEQIIVGLPKSLDGSKTAQTVSTLDFVRELKSYTDLPIALHNEALTSWKAETELDIVGRPYAKGAVDALAAVYILEDYLSQHYAEATK